VGVTRHDERGRMKKQPSDTAREQAKTLRREMTEAEKKIWCGLRLRQTGGYRFRRQVPLGPFIADFVCHEAKLIVEIDGGQHDRCRNRRSTALASWKARAIAYCGSGTTRCWRTRTGCKR